VTIAYKIVDRTEWDAAVASGAYAGSTVDLKDGYIHMSTAEQLPETAARHYAGRGGLVVLTVDLEGLDDLRWEPSRGGALFPHLYAPLTPSRVTLARLAHVTEDGVLAFEDDR